MTTTPTKSSPIPPITAKPKHLCCMGNSPLSPYSQRIRTIHPLLGQKMLWHPKSGLPQIQHQFPTIPAPYSPLKFIRTCHPDLEEPLRYRPRNMWSWLLAYRVGPSHVENSHKPQPATSYWWQTILSVNSCLYGKFDFNRSPLAPPGNKVVVHKTPNQCRTFTPHVI